MANTTTLFDCLSLLQKLDSKNEFKEIVATAFREKDSIRVQRQTIDAIRSALRHYNDKDVEKLFRSLTIIINRCLICKESTHAIVNAVFPEGDNETVKRLLIEAIQETIESCEQASIYSMPSLNSFKAKVVTGGSEPRCALICNLNCVNESEEEQQTVDITIERQQLSEIIEAMSKIRRQLFNAAESR